MTDAEILHPAELSDADVTAWRSLQAATPAFASPLLGPEFAALVGEVRTDARVAVWRRDGAAVGFFPYHRRPTGFGRPIGAPFGDYHALVSRPDLALDAGEALRSAGLGAFRAAGLIDPFAIFADAATTSSPAYQVVLQGTGTDYLADLAAASQNRAKNHRRYRRRLERDFGEVTLSAPDRRQGAFDQLLTWKRQQLDRTGLHDFLQPAWTRALLQRLFEARGERFEGLMISLYAGGRHVAGHFGVRLGDGYHPWIGAMAPELDAYAPGFVHQWEAIGAMSGLGLRVYDLGPGSSHWKAMFASATCEVQSGLLTGPSLAGRLAGMSERVWAAPPLGRTELAGRLRNRLDQIATMELTLGGRVRGVIGAVAGLERRAASRRQDHAA